MVLNRALGRKARTARRLGRDACLHGGRNPYDFRPIGSEQFILWMRFALGYLYALNQRDAPSPEPNPKRGSPPFPEVEAAVGGSNSPDVSNTPSAGERQ